MRIFLFELKKLYRDKKLYLLLLMTLLINIGFVYYHSIKDISYHPKQYQELYQEFDGMDGKEALQLLNLKKQELKAEDFKKQQLLDDVERELQSIVEYDNYKSEIQDKAKNMLRISIFEKSDSFETANIKKTAQDYANMKPAVNIKPGVEKGIQTAFDSQMADFLIFLILLAFVQALLFSEKKSGMLRLEKNCAGGHQTLAIGKLMALFIGVGIAVFLMTMVTFGVGASLFGFGDLKRSIQSIDGFRDSIKNIDIGSFLAVYILFRILLFYLIAVVIFLLAYFFHHFVLTYAIVGGGYGISAILYFGILPASSLNFFKYVNLFYFLKTEKVLGNYLNINILGRPTELSGVYLCFLAGALFLALMLFIVVFCNVKLRVHTIKQMNGRKHGTIKTKLFFHEWYKLWITNRGIIFILMLVMIQRFYLKDYKEKLTPDESYYHYYVNELGGNLTGQMEEKIEKEKNRFEQLQQESMLITEQEKNGELTREEARAKIQAVQQKLEPQNTFEEIRTRYGELKELSEIRRPQP